MHVIGKSKKARRFKGIRRTPCLSCAQKKSWMDSELFEEWVREQDRKFALEERKVALVIDNCITHPNIENLKWITPYVLPPNKTSCLEPCVKYRSRIFQKIIRAVDNGKQIPSIPVLEAMKMLVPSWSEVSETTIINCFRKARFKEGMSDEDNDPFFTLKSSIDQLRQRDENLVPNLQRHVNS